MRPFVLFIFCAHLEAVLIYGRVISVFWVVIAAEVVPLTPIKVGIIFVAVLVAAFSFRQATAYH
jgi:hypothetical protein